MISVLPGWIKVPEMPFARWRAETVVLFRAAISESESPCLTTQREEELDLGLVAFATTFGFGLEVTSFFLDATSTSFFLDVTSTSFFLDATSTSLARTGFEVLLTSVGGLESERGMALEGGCSLEAMLGGTSSDTGEEFLFPHLDGLSAQDST